MRRTRATIFSLLVVTCAIMHRGIGYIGRFRKTACRGGVGSAKVADATAGDGGREGMAAMECGADGVPGGHGGSAGSGGDDPVRRQQLHLRRSLAGHALSPRSGPRSQQ
jgi:hypothetical protein